ncbi:MAG: F-type H+-transporting ATPase subunit alpha [Chloroflexi bacterium]|nr:MAG: F-type H+-transporting ATPase subunit alpha [Chloroflexota bacterium]
MAVRPEEIASIIREQIEGFETGAVAADTGTVVQAGDGIARIYGLAGALSGELLEFSRTDDAGQPIVGMALNLEEDIVGAVVLGDYRPIEEGDEVRSTGRVAEVPVGDAMIGRVVNALGEPIDGKGPISTDKRLPIERIAPNVVTRQAVDTPVQTGILAIDSQIPIGRGQRELIIGDRQTGKSAIAIDTIINQKGQGVLCVYVAIGQKQAKVAQVVGVLEKHGAMDHTVVVNAGAAESAALQYMAPYAGVAIAEQFMSEGKDALIVYDDLSKHAWAYRQVSLLLRRPPGREAYPGDVFYLHSRLLERAAKLNDANGGGSITALPIIETQAGDVSAFIPTNVISITDGQIFLETDLFNSGQRPAVNSGVSVSRVGGSAQRKSMRSVAGQLRLDMAQFAELQAFAQFGTSDLDEATRKQLERGQRLSQLLIQPENDPLPLAQQVVLLFAANQGFSDDVAVNKIQDFAKALRGYMGSSQPGLLETITESGELSDATQASLRTALETFKQSVPF